MNYKKIINDSFSALTPLTANEEIIRNVTERAEKKSMKKTFKLRKPVIALCAVTAAATLGTVTVGAATGWDFNKLFGAQITVEDEELGEALMGNAENIRYNVSDDNYKVSLNAVTGSQSEVIVNLEISRKDGTPFTETGEIFGLVNFKPADYIESSDNFISVYEDYSINENGNIEINLELSPANTLMSFAGKEMIISGRDFFVYENFEKFREVNGISGWTSNLDYIDSNVQTVEAETDGYAFLPLEWSVEFTYNPSDASAYVLTGENQTIQLLAESEGELSLKDYEITKLEVSSTSTQLSVSGNYIVNGSLVVGLDECYDDYNEIYLIKNDGSKVQTQIRGALFGAEKGDYEIEIKYFVGEHETAHENFIAVDISEIRAIEINGTTIELR